mmetsp:Transcript_101293/g.312415  ORF Transcript_101293/g.312415 Transcript_101293/m.312415 type:complete len:374 (+) Transcript_101293:58-1179(+)
METATALAPEAPKGRDVGRIVVRSLAGTVLMDLLAAELLLPELQARLQIRYGTPAALQRLVLGGRWLGDEEKLAPERGLGAKPLEVVLVVDSRPAQPSDLHFVRRLASRDLAELWVCAWPAGEELLAVRKVPLKLFASCVRRGDVEHVMSLLQGAKHPHVAQYRFHFQDNESLYFGTELPAGGTLAELLKRSGPLRYDAAAQHFHDLCDALQFLHQGCPRVVHWDLNPETVWIDEAGRVKLRDLGWSSAVVHPFFSLREFSSSAAYLGPETVIGSVHSESLDMWQLGVLLCELLTGRPPFQEQCEAAVAGRILRADLRLPSDLDPDARELIVGLCKKDPATRLTAAQAKAHRFVTKHLQPLSVGGCRAHGLSK